MSISQKFQLLRVILLALAIDSVFNSSSSSDDSNGPVSSAPYINECRLCGLCGLPIDVTLVFNNVLKEPFFNFHVTIHNEPQRQLIYFLQAAANEETKARFTSSYWGTLGYFIESINQLAGNIEDKTFWRILDQTTGISLNLGVSSYIPSDQQILEFNFTTYSNYEDH